ARGTGGLDADRGVLEDHAARGGHAEPARDLRPHLGIGLAQHDVVGGDHHVEEAEEAQIVEEALRVPARGGGADRARHPELLQGLEELAYPEHRIESCLRARLVEVALATGQPPRLRVADPPSQQQGNRLLARPPDGEPPVLRIRRLRPHLVQQHPPRVPMVRPAVDEDTVHVEDRGGGHGPPTGSPGHARRRPRVSAGGGNAGASSKRWSAAWGSAGAISGPPQMKSLEEVNARPPITRLTSADTKAPANETSRARRGRIREA